MLLQRRGFLLGLGASLIAAPAIVRAASIMPVKAIKTSIIYNNRTIRHYMDIEAIRDKNILLLPDTWDNWRYVSRIANIDCTDADPRSLDVFSLLAANA